MITIAMSTVIGAVRLRVWRALTAPSEVIRWDERILALMDEAPGYPRVGQSVRWRYRLGTVPVTLRDRPLEVVAPERLRSAIALGLLRLDETFLLGEEPGQPDRTRLSLRLVAQNSVPVVGGVLDRFGVRRIASDYVGERLQAVQKWCENHP